MCNLAALALSLFGICLTIVVVGAIRRRMTRAPAQPKTGSKSGNDSDISPGSKPVFLIKPYLQPGTNPGGSGNESLEIRWFAISTPGDNWTLEVRRSPSFHRWFGSSSQLMPLQNDIEIVEEPGAKPLHATQYHVVVSGLKSGETFEYKVLKNGSEVFSAPATARKDVSQPYRFVAVGDMGEAKPEQMKVAHQIFGMKPDFIAMPGDLAYKRGRISEYLLKYFPQMNADSSSPWMGAPLLRSIIHFACLGNHDYGRPDLADQPNLDEFPDLFGYFIFWSQPANGPDAALSERVSQKLIGEKLNVDRFLNAAQGRYPRMASYSYDYGNSHWLVLDANSNVDWTNKELQDWVRRDLMASKATWKFVMFHQPPFTTHRKHGREQRMRLLARIFEECGVDIVFNGHAHLYERSFPLTFAVTPKADGSLIGKDGSVDGVWTLDREFNGSTVTKPKGVIYIVTGAGGAKLQEQHLPPEHESWYPTTATHSGEIHSFTVCDVDGATLILRQITLDGDVLERLVITK